MISAIEELWYGNLSPMEYNDLQDNPDYKTAIHLTTRNQARLQEQLTEEQTELLMKYSESRNELSNITELDAFKTGFTLGVKFIIEALT